MLWILNFSADRYFYYYTYLHQNTLTQTTLLRGDESGIISSPPNSILVSSLPPSLVSFLHPSGSSPFYLQWDFLVPFPFSHDSLPCLRDMQTPLLQADRTKSQPPNPEKDLDPFYDLSNFCAPGISRATSIHSDS